MATAADAEAEAAIGAAPTPPTHAAADAGDEKADSLPLETRWPPFPLRRLGGFWIPEPLLPAVAAIHAGGKFVPTANDMLLASFPKSGTSWLKALAFAVANRADHPPSAADHPLRRRSPHDLVNFFEMTTLTTMNSDDIAAVDDAPPPPRVLATHLPYSMLPESITGGDGGGGCRIIYVCRNPKDTVVSFWHFSKKMALTMGVDPSSFTFDQAFDLFCSGNCTAGPQWRHVIEYWEASHHRNPNVLFLRYEEMLRRPAMSVRRMAEFMGCPFTAAEEDAGVVDAVVELCSIGELRKMEVNKKGTDVLGVRNESYFRKGVAGDWVNHMSPEMAARLDRIVDDATRGSGLTLTDSSVY
uniref:Sulfotransferase n=1 Tax=Leersia perrieri TaxID=77586 RepID=A0A0D9XGK1_9ORYZ